MLFKRSLDAATAALAGRPETARAEIGSFSTGEESTVFHTRVDCFQLKLTRRPPVRVRMTTRCGFQRYGPRDQCTTELLSPNAD
jgi:hypothetical protein